MSKRPAVSVIVPFAGPRDRLEHLREQLGTLAHGPDDEIVIADNGAPAAEMGEDRGVRVRAAEGIPTPAFARNRAAQAAHGEWLVFLDADTIPSPSLLDAYFDPPPDPGTAILAGAVIDAAARSTLVARHSIARAQMNQQTTLARAGSPYAQTANCAVLRSAFEQVGGFEPQARAGEDADLCFRLHREGWRLEERPAATVAHHNREQLAAWLAQLARHGAGAAWVERRWPDEFPPPRPRAFAATMAHYLQQATVELARGEREAAAFALLDMAGACAFELGRLLPNGVVWTAGQAG